MLFSQAFDIFRAFFQEKTGVPWDFRLEKRSKISEELFTYTPPVLGRPIGIVPWGYIRPELREFDESDSPKSATDAEEEAVEYDTDSEVDEDEEQGNESSSTEGQGSENEWEMVVRPPIDPVASSRSNVLYQSWITID
jgi:hypothetical protein